MPAIDKLLRTVKINEHEHEHEHNFFSTPNGRALEETFF